MRATTDNGAIDSGETQPGANHLLWIVDLYGGISRRVVTERFKRNSTDLALNLLYLEYIDSRGVMQVTHRILT